MQRGVRTMHRFSNSIGQSPYRSNWARYEGIDASIVQHPKKNSDGCYLGTDPVFLTLRQRVSLVEQSVVAMSDSIYPVGELADEHLEQSID